MKLNIEFLQTGGVPLTNDLMQDVMSAIQIFDALGELAGHLTIISGCVITGGNIAPGVVAINGELLYFEGGLITPTVYIHEEQVYKTFQDQTDKILIKRRSVRFGNSVTTYNWADFVKLDTIKQIMATANAAATQAQVTAMQTEIDLLKLKTAPIDNGNIVIPWRKPANEIPAGWKECVDFRGKTIVGLDPNDTTFNTLNANIGAKTHTLTVNELPSHNHKIPDNVIPKRRSGEGDNGSYDMMWENYNNNIYTENTGGNQPHNNIQPSRIVMFIEPNFI